MKHRHSLLSSKYLFVQSPNRILFQLHQIIYEMFNYSENIGSARAEEQEKHHLVRLGCVCNDCSHRAQVRHILEHPVCVVTIVIDDPEPNMPDIAPRRHHGPVHQRQDPQRRYPVRRHEPPHVGGPQHQLRPGVEAVVADLGLGRGGRGGVEDGGGEGRGDPGAAARWRWRWPGGGRWRKALRAEGAAHDGGRGAGARAGLLLLGGGTRELDDGGERGGLAAEGVEDDAVAPDVLRTAALVVGEAAGVRLRLRRRRHCRGGNGRWWAHAGWGKEAVVGPAVAGNFCCYWSSWSGSIEEGTRRVVGDYGGTRTKARQKIKKRPFEMRGI